MDLSGLHLFDPAVIDSVRHALVSAQDHVAGAVHAVAAAWSPDGGDLGGDPSPSFDVSPGHDDHGRVDTVEAPADKAPEKPSTPINSSVYRPPSGRRNWVCRLRGISPTLR